MDVRVNANSFVIDREIGLFHEGGSIRLKAEQSKSIIMSRLPNHLTSTQSHNDNVEWLNLDNLPFGGQLAALDPCFIHNDLREDPWSAGSLEFILQGSWPTRESIDAEVAFVRKTLADSTGLHLGRTNWGEIWSTFDAQGSLAAHGFRYRPA